MSAVTTNYSFGTAPSSPEPARASTSSPSGAFSFASVLNEIGNHEPASAPTVASGDGAAASDDAPTHLDRTTEASEPFSIEAGLAALGYGAPEAAPAPSSRVIGTQARQTVAPATSRAAFAVASAPASSSDTSAVTSAGQNRRDTAPVAARIAASPTATVPRSSSASGQTRTGLEPQPRAASKWQTYSITSALPSNAALQGASSSSQTQTSGSASRGAQSSSGRTQPRLAAMDAPASGSSQTGATTGMASRDPVPQALASQGFVAQPEAAPDVVSQASVSEGSDAGKATKKTAAVVQNSTGAPSRTDSSPAALAAAADVGSPLFASATDTMSNAALANPLAADPSLGLQSLQSRTHLAMTNAVSIRTTGSRATALASAQPVSAGTQPATSSKLNAQPGGREAAGERAAPPPPIATVDADATGKTAAAALTLAGAGLDSGSSGPTPIPLSQLADFVADEASSLSSPNPAAPASPSSSALAPQAVKELEISLDPVNLGALSVKMRLANGKLSIVISASSSSTLTAIENERSAITASLGSTQQPLESLVIRSQDSSNEPSRDFSQTASGDNDASDQGNSRQARSNDDSSGAQRGGGDFARGRNPSAGGASAGSTMGGGTGALLV